MGGERTGEWIQSRRYVCSHVCSRFIIVLRRTLSPALPFSGTPNTESPTAVWGDCCRDRTSTGNRVRHGSRHQGRYLRATRNGRFDDGRRCSAHSEESRTFHVKPGRWKNAVPVGYRKKDDCCAPRPYHEGGAKEWGLLSRNLVVDPRRLLRWAFLGMGTLDVGGLGVVWGEGGAVSCVCRALPGDHNTGRQEMGADSSLADDVSRGTPAVLGRARIPCFT